MPFAFFWRKASRLFSVFALTAILIQPFAVLAQSEQGRGGDPAATGTPQGTEATATTPADSQQDASPADPQTGTLPGQASPTATDAVTKDKGDKGKPGDGDGEDPIFSIQSGEDETVYDHSRESKEKKLKAEPDIQTGALNYSYPIKTPPGRNGLHPDPGPRFWTDDSRV